MNIQRSLSAIMVAFATGFLLLAACSNDGDNGNGDTQGGGGQSGTTLRIVAEDTEFDKDELRAPANTEVSLEFVNEDQGVLHNLSVYASDEAREAVFSGELFAGVETRSYTFETPESGEYFFRCDVHPETMTGTFIVE